MLVFFFCWCVEHPHGRVFDDYFFSFIILNRLTIECRIEEKRISADKNQISELKLMVVKGEEVMVEEATTKKKVSCKRTGGNWDINQRKFGHKNGGENHSLPRIYQSTR